MEASVAFRVTSVHLGPKFYKGLHIFLEQVGNGEMKWSCSFAIHLCHWNVVASIEEEYREDTFISLGGTVDHSLVTCCQFIWITFKIK